MARLNIEDSFFGSIINGIDETNILHLKNGIIPRISLMEIAAAIGLLHGGKTPLKQSRDFVRQESIPGGDKSLITSVAFQDLKDLGEDERIVDDDALFGIFEQYANTGFKVIGEWIDDMDGDYGDDSQETRIYMAIAELDRIYEELFDDTVI